VLAGVNVEAVTHAGAFLIGAIIATIAVLRVVRHVAVLFGGEHYRHPRRRPDEPDEPDDPLNL
jgi:hypothetical protein